MSGSPRGETVTGCGLRIAPAPWASRGDGQDAFVRFRSPINAQCCKSRQVLAENQKFNYACPMNNAVVPNGSAHTLSRFEGQEATRKIFVRFSRVTH